LNIIFKDRKFKNLNTLEGNYPSIDLGDDLKDLAIQVTSTTSLAKVRNTIEKYKSEYGYKNLVMLYAKMDKPSRTNGINNEGDGTIIIQEWSIKDLCEKINDLEDGDIFQIQEIVQRQVTPELYDHYRKNEDSSATDEYDSLEQKDIRNFNDKFLAVCPEINNLRLIKYSRDIASGEAELSKFSERQIRSMKYRIFEVCQEELIDFCEQYDTDNKIDLKVINQLIDRYTEKACAIIEEKSKDYSYPLKNKDLLKKIVLALINDCYLSFDEKGIYV
jgi:hypothetical protein